MPPTRRITRHATPTPLNPRGRTGPKFPPLVNTPSSAASSVAHPRPAFEPALFPYQMSSEQYATILKDPEAWGYPTLQAGVVIESPLQVEMASKDVAQATDSGGLSETNAAGEPG